MTKILSFLILVGALMTCSLHVSGQTGNEWIDYNRNYYKIPTGKDGIHRLTYNDLANAGIPVGSIDPSTIRIYHRGTEQSILVTGEGDHQLDPADYLEFYGQRNDGTLDTKLYNSASDQPHKYYNLFSDTTAYFLTFGGGAGKRMPVVTEGRGTLTTEPYYYDEKRQVNADLYTEGTSLFSQQVAITPFDHAEGWSGSAVAGTTSRSYTLTGINRTNTSSEKPQLEVLLVGLTQVDHQAQVYAGASARLWKTVSFLATTSLSLRMRSSGAISMQADLS